MRAALNWCLKGLKIIILLIFLMETVAAEDVHYGTIYGQVYDAKTKQPISGAWVYCQEAKCPMQLTDCEGRYAIKNGIQPLGTYTIECARYGYQLKKNITRTDSRGKANADFSLEPLSAAESSDSLQRASNGSVPPQSESRKAETTPGSGKVSGTGSIRKEYRIMNGANDHANLSVDILNATYYEYEYNIHSDEARCLADLDLAVKKAESITCSGIAKNRDGIPADITIRMKNGDLTYSNYVVASDQGVQASQNIIETTGRDVDVNGEALGDDDTIMANIIRARHSESLNGTQKISAGEDTSICTSVNAVAGPLYIWSYTVAEDRIINATADVSACSASVNQSMNLTGAYQRLKGMTGGSSLETSAKNAAGNGSHLYATAGSGDLQLSQLASAADASYEMNYEYMPVSYSTGTYDTEYARASSEVNSDKKAANDLLASNCEQMHVSQKTDLGEDLLTHIGLDAIAGPLDVRSYIAAEDRILDATADVDAGSVSIDQGVNLTDASQSCKGVAGGCMFFTAITNAEKKTTRAFTTLGSGNVIDLAQLASLKDAWYRVEYEYVPVSYQTGTYDTDLNTSRIDRY